MNIAEEAPAIYQTRIPAGYEQTEIGVIPKDWEVRTLKEIAQFASGTTPRREQNERYFQNGNIFWVKTMDLNNNEISDTSEKITDIALKETSSLKIFAIDTILIAMYGGYNQIGRTGILKINACVNQALTAIQPDKNVLKPLFLINYLNYRVGYWKDVATSSRKDPNITSKDVKDFPIPLPPVPEQTAIATALSDADALITNLEKLIHKKRLIKQGAMQELLTPKEGWEVKKLGEVCEIFGRIGFRGYTVNDIVGKEQGAITISPSNLQDDKMDFTKCTYISWFKYEESPEIKIFNGDILLVKTGSTSGKTAIIKNLKEKATINPQIVVLKKVLIDNLFLSYIMSDQVVQNQIKTTIVGGAIPTLSQKQIANFKIPVPPTKEEQAYIATILSDMDLEISQLEAKLEKYKQIKAGMMQSLLTGKIRLI
jgi:type I restriction enzyme S subunit